MTPILRFAPSPTGMMHVGNARTALLNWLFAKKYQGQFILRFDDTDLVRSKPEYAQAISQDLAWLGWGYDEVFYQSSRLHRYNEAVSLLKEKNLLYPCYESPEELDFKRKRQLSQGRPPVYDRGALRLTPSQIQALKAEGRTPHWRFLLTHETISWQDLAHGDISIDTCSLSDPILIREDGSPVYTLSSVVDDLDYRITHILRGNDHITNTAVQILLLKALDPHHSCPVFGHFPLMVAEDGGALSKRLGSLGIRDLKDQGIEALSISSYLARLGTREDVVYAMSLQELIDGFDTEKFAHGSPKLSVSDLERLNSKLVHHLPFEVVKDCVPAMPESLWLTLRGNLNKISDVEGLLAIIQEKVTPAIEDPDYMAQALEALPSEPWNQDTWSLWTQALKTQTGRKGKELFMPLRLALTAQNHGPEMSKVLPLLKRSVVEKRLQGATA